MPSFSGSGLNLAQAGAQRSSHSHRVLQLLLRVPTCQGRHSRSHRLLQETAAHPEQASPHFPLHLVFTLHHFNRFMLRPHEH